jgi:phosphoribosyl-AMP cyclohydrolase
VSAAAGGPAAGRSRAAKSAGSEGLEEVVFSSEGLVPAIVQDAKDGAVLMLAYMDAEALRRTLESGRSWFWSRSRQEYWCKGESSGNRQHVREVRYDCDGDAVLLVVDQEGDGACHTGERSCFFRAITTAPPLGAADAGHPGRGVADLER